MLSIANGQAIDVVRLITPGNVAGGDPGHLFGGIGQGGVLKPDMEPAAPLCASANDIINPLPPSLFYGPGRYAHRPPDFGSPNSYDTDGSLLPVLDFG